jgi:diketogulonate reductase-like aldo/keto reductase
MQQLMASGAVQRVGVSNFSVDQMKRASDALGSPLFCNQVKLHVNYRQDEVVRHCQQEDILVTAYTPLNKGRVGQREVLRKIGEKHGKSGLQVALRWLIQQDHLSAIPKSSDPRHQAENFEIFDFELSEEDMQRIDQLA